MTTSAPAVKTSPTLRRPTDHILFAATLLLVVLGLWMVFDASYVKTLDSDKLGHNAYHFVQRQAQGWIVGTVALFVMMQTGYWRLRRFAAPLMIIGLLLLAAVYLPHVGVRINNATRWIRYPITWQPSEFAKMTLLFYLAALLSRPTLDIGDLGSRGLGPLLCVTAVYLILIDREPDLGTAIVLFMAALTQFFMAGAKMKHILGILAGAGAFIALFGFAFGHRSGRIQTFLHPERDKQGPGYQTYHSKLAVGSGGLVGVGLGQGREKYYLPEPYNDFIFATIAEEFGLVGTVSFLGLFCLVGWRGFRIACSTKDRFGALLAAGIAALISWQAIINIAVATNSIPATGVPLPFVSYGSSSLFFLLGGIGILLNIAQHPTPPGQVIATRGRE